MKQLHPIHQTPEERSASKMAELASLGTENLTVLKNIDELVGNLAGNQQALFYALEKIAEKVVASGDQSKVVSKLEEIKSANLVANRLLKEIRDKECPAMPEIPPVDFTATNNLLSDLISKVGEEKNVTVTLSIEWT